MSIDVLRDDNYILVNVVCLLYVYVIGSCLPEAAGDNVLKSFHWNVVTKVIKYNLKNLAVVIPNRIKHTYVGTSCVN